MSEPNKALLIDADLVEAVVQLPKDLFYGAGIPACWLVLNNDKPTTRANVVKFIDASDLYERVDTKNALTDSDVNRIVDAFERDDTEPGFSALASVDEIAERAYNLVVRRYVRGEAAEADDAPDLDEAVAAYRAARSRRAVAQATVDEVLARLEDA